MSDAGIDDSSVERWLSLCWKPCQSFGWRIHIEREASFFSSQDVIEEKKSNLCRSSLSQKFSFRSSFFKWRQNLLLYHMYRFDGEDENKVDQSLIFFFHFRGPAILQGRMTSWDWSLRRLHWKLFKWSFLSRRWSRRRCRISNLDSCVDQKNHLDKDAQKKCSSWSRDVRWPASIFPFLDLLSRRPKSWIFDQIQFPTSPKYFRFPELLYSTYIVCMVGGKNVVVAPARM